MVEAHTQLAYLAVMPKELPQIKTPDLCEIWTWQGDTSILPFKFESVLNSAAADPAHIGFSKSVF